MKSRRPRILTPEQLVISARKRAAIKKMTARQQYYFGLCTLRMKCGRYMPFDEPFAIRQARIGLWTAFQDVFGFEMTERIFKSWEWAHR